MKRYFHILISLVIVFPFTLDIATAAPNLSFTEYFSDDHFFINEITGNTTLEDMNNTTLAAGSDIIRGQWWCTV